MLRTTPHATPSMISMYKPVSTRMSSTPSCTPSPPPRSSWPSASSGAAVQKRHDARDAGERARVVKVRIRSEDDLVPVVVVLVEHLVRSMISHASVREPFRYRSRYMAAAKWSGPGRFVKQDGRTHATKAEAATPTRRRRPKRPHPRDDEGRGGRARTRRVPSQTSRQPRVALQDPRRHRVAGFELLASAFVVAWVRPPRPTSSRGCGRLGQRRRVGAAASACALARVA